MPKGSGADLFSRVNHQYLASFNCFDGQPLHVRLVVVVDAHVHVLAGRRVAERKRLPNHPKIGAKSCQTWDETIAETVIQQL